MSFIYEKIVKFVYEKIVKIVKSCMPWVGDDGQALREQERLRDVAPSQPLDHDTEDLGHSCSIFALPISDCVNHSTKKRGGFDFANHNVPIRLVS